MSSEKLGDRAFVARERRDVDELARQSKRVHWILACDLCLVKNASCSRCTASATRVSSIAKVKLTLEAPCEMSVTLMSLIVLKTRAAMPRSEEHTSELQA